MKVESTDPERKFLNIVIYSSLGAVTIMIVIAVITFLLTIESKELTMVPDMKGLDLANAVIDLQDRALFAEVQQRYSNNMADKGTVLGQDPKQGTLVKAGTRVLLKVSKGASVEKLDDYTGWGLIELENHLKSLVTSYGPLLKLNKPYIYIYNDSPPGTVLEQKPLPGTEITILTDLSIVVSKGREGSLTPVRDYSGTGWQRALQLAIADSFPFTISARTAQRGEVPGMVISQSPSTESEVPADTVRQIYITEPVEIEQGYLFGILEKELPVYPVKVPVEIKSITPGGVETSLAKLYHAGGLLTIPYIVSDGSTITISINGDEKIREVVRSLTIE
ncbi:MAG: PASTA domain-containing protein [Spirochaetia bacterium]|jgi:beta-lactam-binding protein with PASTA domain|nr:PASTA domain-containing protein [Spirochaetia bacterium]